MKSLARRVLCIIAFGFAFFDVRPAYAATSDIDLKAIAKSVAASVLVTLQKPLPPAFNIEPGNIRAMALSVVNQAYSGDSTRFQQVKSTAQFLIDEELVQRANTAYAVISELERRKARDTVAVRADAIDEQLDGLTSFQHITFGEYLLAASLSVPVSAPTSLSWLGILGSRGSPLSYAGIGAKAAGIGYGASWYNNRPLRALPESRYSMLLPPTGSRSFGNLPVGILLCKRFAPHLMSRTINLSDDIYIEDLRFNCGAESAVTSFIGSLPLGLIQTVHRHPRFLDLIPDSLAIRDLNRIAASQDPDTDIFDLIAEDPELALRDIIASPRPSRSAVRSTLVAQSRVRAKDFSYLFPSELDYRVADAFPNSDLSSENPDAISNDDFNLLATKYGNATNDLEQNRAIELFAQLAIAEVKRLPDPYDKVVTWYERVPDYQCNDQGCIIIGYHLEKRQRVDKVANIPARDAIRNYQLEYNTAHAFVTSHADFDMSSIRCGGAKKLRASRTFVDQSLANYLAYYEFVAPSGSLCKVAFKDKLAIDDSLRGDIREALVSDPSFISGHGLEFNSVHDNMPALFGEVLYGERTRLALRNQVHELLRSADLMPMLYAKPSWLGDDGSPLVDRGLLIGSANGWLYGMKLEILSLVNDDVAVPNVNSGALSPDVIPALVASFDKADGGIAGAVSAAVQPLHDAISSALNHREFSFDFTGYYDGNFSVIPNIQLPDFGPLSFGLSLPWISGQGVQLVLNGTLSFGDFHIGRGLGISIVPPSRPIPDVPGVPDAPAPVGGGPGSIVGSAINTIQIPIYSQPNVFPQMAWGTNFTSSGSLPGSSISMQLPPTLGAIIPPPETAEMSVAAAYLDSALVMNARERTILEAVLAGKPLSASDYELLRKAEAHARSAEGRFGRSIIGEPITLVSKGRPNCVVCVHDPNNPVDVTNYIDAFNAKARTDFSDPMAGHLHSLHVKYGIPDSTPLLTDGLPSAHYTADPSGRYVRSRFTYLLRTSGQISLLQLAPMPLALQAAYKADPKSRELEYWGDAVALTLARSNAIPVAVGNIEAAIVPFAKQIHDRVSLIESGNLTIDQQSMVAQLSAEIRQFVSEESAWEKTHAPVGGDTPYVPPIIGAVLIGLLPTPAMIVDDRADIVAGDVRSEFDAPLAAGLSDDQKIDFLPQSGMDQLMHSTRINIGEAKDRIRWAEGFLDHVYPDTKKYPTAFYGYRLDKSGSDKELRDVIQHSLAEVKARGFKVLRSDGEKLLNKDLDTAVLDARALVGSVIFDGLTAPRQFTLVDMEYNIGSAGLSKYTAFLQAVQEGKYNLAADEMMNSMGYGQAKGRSVVDVDMMRRGVWVPIRRTP